MLTIQIRRTIFVIALGALLFAGMTEGATALELNDSPLEIGGSVRLRGYDLQNYLDFNDQQDFDHISMFRLKSSVFMQRELGQGVSGYIRLSHQTYGESGYKSYSDAHMFLDNAWIKVDRMFDLPITFKAGRQDVRYGSGFVLFDGQSSMGSNATFFDGLKVSWSPFESLQIDGLYLKEQENNKADHDAPPAITEDFKHDDIDLRGVYITFSPCRLPNSTIELYGLQRVDGMTGMDVWTTGLRHSYNPGQGLDYCLEGAFQLGNNSWYLDQESFGLKMEAGYKFSGAKAPRPYVRYVLLSGDDPTTEVVERWDMVYGGWPQFGDLLAWKYLKVFHNTIRIYDPGLGSGRTNNNWEAVYSNLQIAQVGITFKPAQQIKLDLSYSLLTIPEAGSSNSFGDYFQLSADYQYSDRLSFALYAAIIEPGDAFTIYDDPATEIFWETKLTF